STEINTFLQKKIHFDKQIMLGKFDEAKQSLEQIQADYGYSIWGIRNMLLVEEFRGGLEASSKILNEINGIQQIDQFVRFFSNFFKLRSEKQISYENYNIKLSKMLELPQTDIVLKDYLGFVLNANESLPNIESLPFILFESSKYSIIDRYLTFVRVAHQLSLEKDPPEWFNDYVLLGTKKLKSAECYNLSCIINCRVDTQFAEQSEPFLDILDEYTAGRYESCYSKCELLLKDYPEIIELYDIYIKSAVILSKTYNHLFPDGSFADIILTYLDNKTKGQIVGSEQREIIYKTALLLDDTASGMMLKKIINNKNGKAVNHLRLLTKLNCHFLNPSIAFFHQSSEKQLQLIESIVDHFHHRLTIKFTEDFIRLCSSNVDIVFAPEIDPSRSTYYKAISQFRKSNFSDSLILFHKLYSELQIKKDKAYPFLENILPKLFRCYLFTGKILEAAQFAVSHYLVDAASVKYFDLKSLITEIENNLGNDLMRHIEIPIIYSIVHQENRMTYVAYDNFLNANKSKTPLQLISSGAIFDKTLMLHFLRHICTLNVMRSSYQFSNTISLEQERVAICQHLIVLDAVNKEDYLKEIESINTKLLVRQTVRQIDESKIYVDEEGIKRTGEKIIKENYLRYIEYSTHKGAEEFRIMDTKTMFLSLKSKKDDSNNDFQVLFISLNAAFRDLFFDIRDRFISSNEYGLDSYLSVRIRHGTLQGHIRNTFERLNLISQIDSETKFYTSNPYWNEKLSYKPQIIKDQVQEKLKSFSERIDNITFFLKDTLLQIKTEDRNPDGLFDYSYEDFDLLGIYTFSFRNISNYESFIDNIFQVLWKRTNENLQKIREYLNTKLQKELYDLLTNLYNDIKLLLPNNDVPELLSNITICMTSVQIEIDKLSRWFYVTGKTLPFQFNFNELVAVCVSSINNLHSLSPISPKIDSKSNIIINGDMLPHFADILRTLLENIIKHSGVDAKKNDIYIKTHFDAQYFTLSFDNLISPEVRSKDPVAILSNRLKELQSGVSLNSISKEGGTGLPKISKIIKYDLKIDDYKFFFSYPTENVFRLTIKLNKKGLLYEKDFDSRR
ncbi:MAG: hypothetical protein HUU02_02770, partial [Bacteroidetes bacterium]|nr:hypothetical protein [Bacteroidota bacterium]